MAGGKVPIRGEQAGGGQDARPTLKLDCRHYRGDRPCAAGIQGLCPSECPQHQPPDHRILIIKLGALGDVIRTAALLPGLKERWPRSHITWVTRANGVRMLANQPLIDRRLPLDAETICHLEHERFDLCLSLDKEPAPAGLAVRIDTLDRRGIGLSRFGTPYPLNPECVHYFQLGLDDELKFRRNQETYQELIYAAVGLEYRGQQYQLYPTPEQCRRAAGHWRTLGVSPDEVVIGLNTGAGRAFANKTWPAERWASFARRIVARPGWRAVLLGGPEERVPNQQIAAECPGILDAGCDHAELEFVALLDRCQVVVTGDTMAMHAAIARQVPCVVLFGPTCEQEVDLYGRGTKLRTALPCAPCYRRTCDQSPNCMDDLSVESVLAAVDDWVGARRPTVGQPLPVVGASV